MRRRGLWLAELWGAILAFVFLLLACEPSSTYRPSRPPSPSSADPAFAASWRQAQVEVDAALARGDPDAAQAVLVGFQRQIVAAEGRGTASRAELIQARGFVARRMEQVEALREEAGRARIRETVNSHLQEENFEAAYRFLNFVWQTQTDSSGPMAQFCEAERLRVETAEIDTIERRVRRDLAQASQASLRRASGSLGVYINTRDFSDAGMERLLDLERLVAQARSVNRPPPPAPPPPIVVSRPPVDPPEVPGLVFAYVPAKTYSFGTPADEFGRESIEPTPASITIESFFISTTEVTQEAFTSVVRHTWKEFVGPRLPAHSVNFDDAEEFCRKLTGQGGDMTFSLPTEVEWEVAARAGKRPSYGPVVGLREHRRRFLAGLDEARQALQNYAFFSANKTGPGPVEVCQKKANPLGLCDMHGNVAEWARPEPRLPDLYRDVLLEKPLRGGSVQSPYERCRAGSRALEPAATSTPTVGFRIIARPR